MFRKSLIIFSLILLVLFTLPSAALAANDDGAIVKVGSDIYVEPTENYEAIIGVGSNIKVDGNAHTVVAVGGDIEMNGNITDAVVAIGGDVFINKEVYGDLVVIGGKASLGNEAIIHGDLVMVGEERQELKMLHQY